MSNDAIEIKRATGLLVIEARNSNPNGDPDNESDPRIRSHDKRGLITGVSFKRKLRDLVENKESEVWKIIRGKLNIENNEEFCILESRDRGFKDVKDATDAWKKVLDLIDKSSVANKYWDARIFGATFLEKGEDAPGGGAKKDRKYIRTGVAQFGLGLTVAPIRIERGTLTKKTSAQEGKDRGMAPFGDRHIEHGVYCMPFFVNPSSAKNSGCTAKDIALMLSLIKCAYPNTISNARPGTIEVRHAWYGEHNDPLGSFSEFHFIDSMTPSKEKPDEPSKESMDKEYEVPKMEHLPADLKGKVKNFCDLCETLPDWCQNV